MLPTIFIIFDGACNSLTFVKSLCLPFFEILPRPRHVTVSSFQAEASLEGVYIQ